MAYTPERLDAVNQVREHQRKWLAKTQKDVADGAPFAICNGDEFEEILLVMGIPVVAINYWNFLIAAQGKVGHYNEILHERGFAGPHFFALGLASTIDPANAPWGGLPKPAIICGSLRYESELRVTEHWAREYGSPNFPMDHAFPSPKLRHIPDNWYELIRDDWEQLVDPRRLDFRVAQERACASYVEQLTGRTLSITDLQASLELLNVQMDYWAEARALIAASEHCPVHMKDQMSMYQAMWHRGTKDGIKLCKDYRDEVADRVAKGTAAYKNEKWRFHFGNLEPAFGRWAEDTHGLVATSCSYTGLPDCYARTVHNNDPMRSLAARHLQLFFTEPNWIHKVAHDHQADAVIMIEEFCVPGHPSLERQRMEAEGIPYLGLPRDADDAEVRELINEFVETRLEPRGPRFNKRN